MVSGESHNINTLLLIIDKTAIGESVEATLITVVSNWHNLSYVTIFMQIQTSNATREFHLMNICMYSLSSLSQLICFAYMLTSPCNIVCTS